MANPMDILHQLQVKLDHNYITGNIKVNVDEDEELGEDIGQNSTAGLASQNIGNAGGKDIDVDNANAADKEYVTHRAYPTANDDEVDETKIKIERILATFEQEMPEEAPPEETAAPPEGGTPPEVPPEEGGEEMPPEEGMDPSMAGGDMGGDMGGMPGEEETKNASEIGRIYELKKIYTRLTTIESYLSDSSDPDLLRIRLLVSKSIELFEILSANIPSYKPPKAEKGTIDEIIIMYYKFLDKVYESVAKHYKEQNTKLGKDVFHKATVTIANKELI